VAENCKQWFSALLPGKGYAKGCDFVWRNPRSSGENPTGQTLNRENPYAE
jgi:hypothetical protein